MNINDIIFREYDIRGIVGTDFNLQDIQRIGNALAIYIKQQTDGNKIVIAYDGRLSSPDIYQNLIYGLQNSRAEIISLGRGPTPMLYYASFHYKANGAIMITGSHNAKNINGLKIMMDCRSIHGAQIQKLKDTIKNTDYVPAAAITQPIIAKNSDQLTHQDIIPHYVNYLLNDFNKYYNAKSMRIAWDPGNGANGEIIQDILQELDGEHYIINEEIDGKFPNRSPDPTILENLTQLRQLISELECDFGIAFDGDGDRIVIIDNEGEMLHNEHLLYIFAKEIIKKSPGAKIVVDIKTGENFLKNINKMGGESVLWKTGHSLIKEKMQEIKASLGGEMSGHIFFADRYFGFDDAIYAALRFIGIMNKTSQSLSNIINEFPSMYSTSSINIPCNNIDKFQIIESLKLLLNKNGVIFNDLDGIRVTEENNSWWLIRASNTQEILVIRAEAISQEKMQQKLQNIANYLEQVGIAQSIWLNEE